MKIITLSKLLLLTILTSSPCAAGFVTIDEFTNATQSDHLGTRTSDGKVDHKGTYISMVSGTPETNKVAQLFYSFVPSPLVVKPKFVLTVKNNQTTYLESGWLRVSINNKHFLQEELFAAQQGFQRIVFDFTNQVSASETISELQLDWLRPDGTTGVRELLINSIVVSDVPEPPTFLLLAVCLSSVGIYHLHKTQRNAKQTRHSHGNRRLRRLIDLP